MGFLEVGIRKRIHVNTNKSRIILFLNDKREWGKKRRPHKSVISNNVSGR